MKKGPDLVALIVEKMSKKMGGNKEKSFLAAKKNKPEACDDGSCYEEDEDDGEADEGEDMYTEIGQELLDAIDSKDAAAFGKALKSFVRVCEED